MARIALVVLYNHHYPQNVDRINALYRGRFDSVTHLIPNYSGESPEVIPVFGNGHVFSSYVAQAYHHIRHYDADHYLFVGDDLVLNPQVNQDNADHLLGLRGDTCFIPLWELDQYYPVAHDAYYWRPNKPGAEVASLLPSESEARRRFAAAGYPVAPVPWNVIHLPAIVRGQAAGDIRKIDSGQHHKRSIARLYDSARGRSLVRSVYRRVVVPVESKRRALDLRYPMIAGYSDIFGISAEHLKTFSTYCGLFAAGGLYCEAAVPTAMILTTCDIVIEAELPLSGAALGPEAIIGDKHWHAGPHRDFAAEVDGDFGRFLQQYPDDLLYYHPVKLSTFT